MSVCVCETFCRVGQGPSERSEQGMIGPFRAKRVGQDRSSRVARSAASNNLYNNNANVCVSVCPCVCVCVCVKHFVGPFRAKRVGQDRILLSEASRVEYAYSERRTQELVRRASFQLRLRVLASSAASNNNYYYYLYQKWHEVFFSDTNV